MLIVLMILTICAVVVTMWTCDELTEMFSGIGAVILGIIDLICIVFIVCYFTDGLVAPQKIKMYEEENKKIEEQIDTLVKQYMEYEGKTLVEFKGDSSVTLVTLYPELKSDTLVSKQVETYIKNNNKIKKLKEAEIDMKIGKWLLYFGK